MSHIVLQDADRVITSVPCTHDVLEHDSSSSSSRDARGTSTCTSYQWMVLPHTTTMVLLMLCIVYTRGCTLPLVLMMVLYIGHTTGCIPYTQMLCMLLHYTQYVVT